MREMGLVINHGIAWGGQLLKLMNTIHALGHLKCTSNGRIAHKMISINSTYMLFLPVARVLRTEYVTGLWELCELHWRPDSQRWSASIEIFSYLPITFSVSIKHQIWNFLTFRYIKIYPSYCLTSAHIMRGLIASHYAVHHRQSLQWITSNLCRSGGAQRFQESRLYEQHKKPTTHSRVKTYYTLQTNTVTH